MKRAGLVLAAFVTLALAPAVIAADLNTQLFEAIEADRIDEARRLLDEGADVNARSSWGATPLLYIANVMDDPVKDHAAWARLFFEHGADVNARTEYGNTALCLAAESDRLNDLLVYLLSVGADFALGNSEGLAPLSIATQHACAKNKAALQAKDAPLYSYQFPVGNVAPACAAVLSGDLETIARIPPAEFSTMMARTSMGVPATPLHLAAERGDLAVIRGLGARKVDWNVGDRYGRSPLQLAVLAGRADVAAALLDAGADPNRPDSKSSSAFSWACAVQPGVAKLFFSRGLLPAGDRALLGAICAGDMDTVKSLRSAGVANPQAPHFAAKIGEAEIAEALGAGPGEIARARENRSALRRYAEEAARPLEAASRSGGIAEKRGTFPYIVESWSPWARREKVNLADYPVGVYVPKDYDGSTPYGLFVSMTNAQSSSRYPRTFEKTLDRHRVIWVGFDPYNGLSGADNPAFCLAIVHNLMGYYSIDPKRVYIGGYSLGGQMAGITVREFPGVFKGMMYIHIGYNGFVSGVGWHGWSDTASLYHSRQGIPIVIVEGDYDYNRLGAYGDYDTLVSGGCRSAHFVQEPMIGHKLISADTFERAWRLLDARGN